MESKGNLVLPIPSVRCVHFGACFYVYMSVIYVWP